MRKIILTMAFFFSIMSLFVIDVSAQDTCRATINGNDFNTTVYVCEGETVTLTAGLTGTCGSAPYTYMWTEKVNGITTFTTTGTTTITVPFVTGSTPTGTFTLGDVYFYTLAITDADSLTPTELRTYRVQSVNPLPTITSASVDEICSDEQMTATLTGLGAMFPVNVKVYADVDGDGFEISDLIHTENNIYTSTVSFSFIATWTGDVDLFFEVVNPVTGCTQMW